MPPNGNRRVVFVPNAGAVQRAVVYFGPEDVTGKTPGKRNKRKRREGGQAAATRGADTTAQEVTRVTDKGPVAVSSVARATRTEAAPRAAAPRIAEAVVGVTTCAWAESTEPKASPKPPVLEEPPPVDCIAIAEDVTPPEAPGDVLEPEPMELVQVEPPREGNPGTPCSVDLGDLPMPVDDDTVCPSLSIEEMGPLVLSRKTLVRLRDRLDFAKLITGCFVRIGLAATGTHTVMQIADVTCGSKPYVLYATRDGRTSYAFQILQLDGNIRIQLSQTSNKPAEQSELEEEQQRIAGQPGFTPEEARARAAAIAAALAAVEDDAARCAREVIERAVASAARAVASTAVGEVDPDLGIRVDGGMLDCIDQQQLDDLRAAGAKAQRRSSSGDVSVALGKAARHSAVAASVPGPDHTHSSSAPEDTTRPPRWQRRWREDGEAFHHPDANAAPRHRIDVYATVSLPTPTQLRRQRREAKRQHARDDVMR